jgi:hypothetical protein
MSSECQVLTREYTRGDSEIALHIVADELEAVGG